MRLVSWNVNGLRAVLSKGFMESFRALNADVFCLQETKLQEGQVDLPLDGYHAYWNYAEKKGYSGVAVFTRKEPLNVTKGLGIEALDHEGRVLTLEFENFYLVACYTPNSQDGLKRLPFRMEWEDAVKEYLLKLKAKKAVVLCGDLNVAHEEIDIANPDRNHMNPGFSDEERGKMSELLNSGFVDSYRMLHPEEKKYSWWSYRFSARERNVGWRIDYFLVSDDAAEQITSAEIHNNVMGSDHCPVSLEIDRA